MLAPTSSPRPLALTDSEITTIMAACRPLSPDDRESFLQHVAAVLAAQPVLGDGVVARVCREIFKQHWKAPELDTRPAGGKYGR
jgi:hypothetical protein